MFFLGAWAGIKSFIRPRHRTIKHLPGKLLEYLWRYENQGTGLIDGMCRCIREVKFFADIQGASTTEDEEETMYSTFFTFGEDGNPASTSSQENTQQEPFEFESENTSSSGSEDEDTDDSDWEPPAASTDGASGLTLHPSVSVFNTASSHRNSNNNRNNNHQTSTTPQTATSSEATRRSSRLRNNSNQ